MKASAPDILLIEDNPGDVMIMKESLKSCDVDFNMHVCSDGEEALKHLMDCLYHKKGIPRLIILDLNLPKVKGKDVLKEIKAKPELKYIPVIILTSSESENDITECYQLGANSFVVKPLSFNLMQQYMQSIESFWFKVVKLPANPLVQNI